MFERSEVLDYLDVIGLKERVKHLNIINHAKGEFYYMKGLMRHNHSSSIEYFVKVGLRARPLSVVRVSV